MGRKNYSKSFKDEACKLVTEQKQAIAPAAAGLGVAEQTLRYWLVQRGWVPELSPLPEQLAESEDPRWLKTRIRDLENKLRRAEMEREILSCPEPVEGKKRRPTLQISPSEVCLGSSPCPKV